MRRKTIKLTESDLHNIIKESVKKLLKEEVFHITLNNNGNEGVKNVKKWRAVADELKTKGSVMIYIPLYFDNTLEASLEKTERGGVYLYAKGLNKEYASISSAISALQSYAHDLQEDLRKKRESAKS